MEKRYSKRKLTVTVDVKVLEKAKRVSEEKRIPLSRAIESFLSFFVNPEVYCFKCGEKFSSSEAELCPKCGWMVCPKCNACRCVLGEEAAIAVFHMRRVYEDLLAGRVK
jgi:hypothetical protein